MNFGSSHLNEVFQQVVGTFEPGKTYLHLAPIGQGKTTLALQFASVCVLDTAPPSWTYFVDAESNYDLRAKLISCCGLVERYEALGRPKKSDGGIESELRRFLGQRGTVLPKVSERIRRIYRLMNKRLHFIDVELCEEYPSFGIFLEMYIAQHQKYLGNPGVKAIVIDGWGAAVDDECRLRRSDRKGGFSLDLSETYRVHRRCFKSLAKKYNCLVYASHQAGPIRSGSDPHVGRTDTVPYYRNLPAEFNCCFASGTIREDRSTDFVVHQSKNEPIRFVLRSDYAAWSPWIAGLQSVGCDPARFDLDGLQPREGVLL